MARKRSAGWDRPVGDRPDQHVGGMLHGLREQAGVSQAEVARDIGIDPSQISRVERGQRPASQRIVSYYGERFGAADLLGGLVDIARIAASDRERVRDPDLIARQAAYPIPGDAATFVSETPPDGIAVGLGEYFEKSWTLHNTGTVAWVRRRLRRVGPITGPWTLTSARDTMIPDTRPGELVSISVDLRAPHVEAATTAHWKMVDAEGLLFFPDRYSVGVGIYVLVR